ncbi:SusD/RagB family nutrient-binding outer membrane lipoprotein [Chitinophaga sp.]|uniref:SusD/RagB family nutrient-binding outer membrane lipoprotein n=1 Tax=Chitinophaga sp. TaxID=1869181 RepID=UPI0031D68C4F
MGKYIYCLLIAGLFSCSKIKDFGDTNENPTAVNTGDAGGFLTYTLAYTASTNTTAGIYVQYAMESQYPGTCFYADNSSSFTGYYSAYLNYLQQIIRMGYAGTTTNNMVQVAKILQQYYYLYITNNWGDVPYSEALQGDANTKPAYDKQEDIYNGIISTIRSAVDSIDASAIDGDIAFDGDPDAWKRVGNSIIMLATIQLSKRYPDANGLAATAFNTALSNAGGYISTNEENFTIVYPGDAYQNLWYQAYYSRSDYGESETMTDLMASLGDTRQHAFGGATTIVGDTTSSAVGLPYGVTRTEIVNWTAEHTNYARILRGDLRLETSPIVLISAAYITLVRAEAANLGWTTESVASLYATGIQLSFDYWGEDIPGEYLAQEGVALGSDNVEKIAIQQFIAVYPNGLYGWNIWRKTGYPALTPSVNAANESGEIPRRFKYATSEATTNPDNLAIAVERLDGGNTDVARMWWDKE